MRPILVIDCGASHLGAARFARDRRHRLILQDFIAEPFPAATPTDEDWAGAVESACAVLARCRDWRGPCVLGLPGHLTLTKGLRVPRLARRRRRQVVAFEAAQGIPLPPADVVWSHVVVLRGAEGDEVVITAARQALLAGLCAGVRRTGLSPWLVMPGWIALWLAAGTRPDSGAGCLLVDVGARSTQLVCAVGTRLLVRTIALGGDLVSQELAGELGIDAVRAESEKRRAWEKSADQPSETSGRIAVQICAERFAGRLGGEIARSLACVLPEQAVGRPELVLTGGGSRLPGLAEHLSRDLQVGVRRWENGGPPGPALAASRGTADLAVDRLVVPCGLAAGAVEHRWSGASLLPRALRRELAWRRWLRTAAVVLALMIASLWPAARQLRARARELGRQRAETERQVANLHRLDARNQASRRQLAETNRRVAALRHLDALKAGWVLFMADLQERLAKTEDVWLDRLEVVAAPGTGDGSTDRTRGRPRVERAADVRAGPKAAKGPRIRLRGCLLNPLQPFAPVGGEAYERVKTLLADLAASPFVAAVENEHFEANQAGVLRFEITIVPAAQMLF